MNARMPDEHVDTSESLPNKHAKAQSELFIQTVLETFRTLDSHTRCDMIRRILSEHDSLCQIHDKNTEHELSAICNFEMAVSNLHAAGLPDVLSELVIFARFDIQAFKSTHRIMPYLVMDWCHQSFRAKYSRGMRFSPEIVSFASTILNACDGSTFRVLSGPGNKYTGNFNSARDLNRSRICIKVLQDYGEMNFKLVEEVQ
uniref:Uncharacterized protein n=1 Tax=Guillardia theta TaxID=55529 RepID=A0A7S4JJN3_GUITH|mmetsp:Transcript_16998/g.56255  ORF Transcript_16998/g.56255 Transcript_16998/m.56255 type:complete len:201 (+) Transcript_16998:215-817(+)